jgi:hypothetical protein
MTAVLFSRKELGQILEIVFPKVIGNLVIEFCHSDKILSTLDSNDVLYVLDPYDGLIKIQTVTKYTSKWFTKGNLLFYQNKWLRFFISASEEKIFTYSCEFGSTDWKSINSSANIPVQGWKEYGAVLSHPYFEKEKECLSFLFEVTRPLDITYLLQYHLRTQKFVWKYLGKELFMDYLNPLGFLSKPNQNILLCFSIRAFGFVYVVIPEFESESEQNQNHKNKLMKWELDSTAFGKIRVLTALVIREQIWFVGIEYQSFVPFLSVLPLISLTPEKTIITCAILHSFPETAAQEITLKILNQKMTVCESGPGLEFRFDDHGEWCHLQSPSKVWIYSE